MLEDDLAVDDFEFLGLERFEADIERACLARIFDDGREEPAEGLEDRVLHVDAEREATIQELLDRRQGLFHRAIRFIERQPSHLLEFRIGAGLDLTRTQLVEELAQRSACVGALKVVLGTEHVLTAGLALSLGDGTQRVEAAGDGGEKALLALHVCGDGAKEWRLRLVRAVGPPETLNRIVGLPPGLQEVMHPKALVLGPEIGVVAAPGATRIGEDQDAFCIVHEGLGFAEVGGGGAVLDLEPPLTRLDDAPLAPRDLSHCIASEMPEDLVERALHRGEGPKMLDKIIPPPLRLAADDRVAIAIEGGARAQIAILVGVRLKKLRREAVHQVVHDVLPRREIDLQIVPVRGRDLFKAAFHHRFAGRDHLNHGRVPCCKVRLDGADQRGTFHGGDEMVEEALLVALEGRTRGGFRLGVQRAGLRRNTRGLKRCLKVVVDDLVGIGVAVVYGDLSGAQLMDQHLVFDPGIGEGPRQIEPKRLQVARDHLHGRNAPGLHRGDELGPRHEGEIAGAPETEARSIGKIADDCGTGRRDIENPCIGRGVLQREASEALLGRLLVAAVGLFSGSIRHGMAFIKSNDPVEPIAEPGRDLIEAGGFALTFSRAQRGVGDEEDALGQADVAALAELRERHDIAFASPERYPVATRIFDELVALRDPDRPSAPFEPIIEDDTGNLSPFTASRAITQKPALAQAKRAFVALGRRHQLAFDLAALEPALEMRLMRVARIDDTFQLRRRKKAVLNEVLRQDGTIGRHGRRHRGHGGGLHQRGRMFRRAIDPDRLKVIGLVDRVLQRAVGLAPSLRQVVDRGRRDIVKRVPCAFFGEGTGFLARGIAQGLQVGAGRSGRSRQGRTGGAGRGAVALRAVGEHCVEKVGGGRADRMVDGLAFDRCDLISASRTLVDHRQPCVDRGAMPRKDLAVDSGGKYHIGALCDPLKRRLKGFRRGAEALAGDDDKPPTRRETR
ncbi:hypothetical protein LOKVESSMR4R_03924 (plasmid) [Yoonia vestfoldensis]|uniref:Uncharacterized protein n=1 Tax=Yoonia vestfoldensis TaxID=245188 RepID=A0A1Y0EHP5_9RHOB|nr:hypothetical protein LOKVESSMR4R_03924 [Yoonia vestfoldensis]